MARRSRSTDSLPLPAPPMWLALACALGFAIASPPTTSADESFEFQIEDGNAVYVCYGFPSNPPQCSPEAWDFKADITSAVFSGTRVNDVWTVTSVDFQFGEPSGFLQSISMAYPLDATTAGCGGGIGPQDGLLGELDRSSEPDTLDFNTVTADCGEQSCTEFWVGITYSEDGVTDECVAASAPVQMDYEVVEGQQTLSGIFEIRFTDGLFEYHGTTGLVTFVPEPAMALLQLASLFPLVALKRRLRS